MDEGDIPQVELDKKDFLNEFYTALMVYRGGNGIRDMYMIYGDKRMRKPEPYFNEQYGHGPAEGFPLVAFDEVVDSFNESLAKKNFTDNGFPDLIKRAYEIAETNLPDDIKDA